MNRTKTPEPVIQRDRHQGATSSETAAPPQNNVMSADLEEQIISLVKDIQSTLITSSGGVTGMMKLPTEAADSRILTLAIEKLLAANFKIYLNRADKGRLKLGASINSIAPSAEGLRPRNVKINLISVPRLLEISGHQPENGENAYTELSFDWKKRSCTIHEDGSIDWKNINSIPSVNENQLLVTFHDRTEGIPGVDCYGKPIRQIPGKRHPIRWAKKNVVRRDDPDNPKIFKLYSASPGAVSFTFLQPGNPKTLDSIDIAGTLTVHGDINYDYGDIVSSASLNISGSLKGNFSLRSEGHVHVKESIEGKNIEARQVKATLITNGCRVFAREEIEAANINNALVNAENIIIRKIASGAELSARNKITFIKNSSFLGIRAHAKAIDLDEVRFSGVNELYLGEELFKEARQAGHLMMEAAAEIGTVAAEGKNAATVMLTLLVQLEKYTKPEGAESVIRKMIIGLKIMLIKAFKSIASIDEKAKSLCYELQAEIGNRKYNESVMRKVDQIVSQIKRYNTIQEQFSDINQKVKKHQIVLESITEQIKQGLTIKLRNGSMMGNNAELKISCGDAYKIIDQTNFSNNKSLIIRYVLPDDADSLEDGELVIAEPQPSAQ